MKSPLWIEKYKPQVSNFPQDDVRRNLTTVSNTDMNLIIGGPKGVGKTVSAEAIVDQLHKDPDNDADFINVADLFGRTKKELMNDEKFSQIASGKRGMSKRDLVNELIKEISSYPPVTGGFRTIVLENAEKSREDFQQSLRRTMERFSSSTQFIFTTRNPSSLIQPLSSRCHTVQIRPPSRDELGSLVSSIRDEEDIELNDSGVDYIWSQTSPNVRRFLLHLQTVHMKFDEVTPKNALEVLEEVSKDDLIVEILKEARNQNYKSVKDKVSTLIDDEGYEADLVIELMIDVGTRKLTDDECRILCQKADVADYKIQRSTDPKTQIVELLSEWSYELRN